MDCASQTTKDQCKVKNLHLDKRAFDLHVDPWIDRRPVTVMMLYLDERDEDDITGETARDSTSVVEVEVDSDDNSLPQTTTASTTASVRQILDPVYEAIAGSQQTNKAEWESFSSDLLGCRESLQRSFL